MSIEKIRDGNVAVCILGSGYISSLLAKTFVIENKSVESVLICVLKNN